VSAELTDVSIHPYTPRVRQRAPAAGPADLDEALGWLRKRFDPEAAGDLRVTYAFDVTGDGGGCFAVRVDAGRLEALPGGAEEADVRLRLEAADLFAVLAGSANVDMLFMQDRIQVRGDLSLALGMRKIFRRPA
jgi:predicted lipid carrier protein YhbT